MLKSILSCTVHTYTCNKMNIQCTILYIQCTLHTYSTQCTLHTYSTQFTLHTYSTQFTLHTCTFMQKGFSIMFHGSYFLPSIQKYTINVSKFKKDIAFFYNCKYSFNHFISDYITKTLG